ncbi:hypothetical protein P40081_28390 [Paenibacillus sp. FSL P4-0081]|uniref:hypothetical protein n=1 Tax=Paenibacillus sp. FSL P4-0081 TaxID=1536769 RepID=UPI0004F8FB32|nr:hypothetical protein [Paenibacillus sp. FSL P4-0081]AIQ31622.1 hypothetical protein P40081_28390 [Paenibacillus sp. FSL P4-0081]
MNYDKEKYNRGKLKLVTQPIIYVEGKTNKIFYQQLDELSNKFIDNGGDCTTIKAKVESEPNSYGIIDHDYKEIRHEKLFPINFYSVENISLIYISKFNHLNEMLVDYIEKHGIEKARIHLPEFIINYEENSRRVRDYNVILTVEKHHDQYIKYIENYILCDASFMRYKNIKKIVESYVSFIKNKYSDRINYITELADYLPTKSIDNIFDTETLQKLKNVI